MNILVDMNLSPEWISVLQEAGHNALHWSTVGAGSAPDPEIMAWARDHDHVVFTHDLDFGAILAATGVNCPSVIQVRTEDVTPEYLKDMLLPILHQFEHYLAQGALIVVDEEKSRVRILPLATRE